MGLVPLRLLREWRSSFVERTRKTTSENQLRYGRLLGQRLFRHREARRRGPQGRRQPDSKRKIVSIKIVYKGKKIQAELVDAGNAEMEVDAGDWAVIKTKTPDLDLPAPQGRYGLRLRVRGSDLPASATIIRRASSCIDRLCGSANGCRPHYLPHRWSPGGLRRRRVLDRRGDLGRHPDRSDARRLSILVHPADARRDVPEGSALSVSPETVAVASAQVTGSELARGPLT